MSASIQRLLKNKAFNRYNLTLDLNRLVKTSIPLPLLSKPTQIKSINSEHRGANMNHKHPSLRPNYCTQKRGLANARPLSIMIVLIRSLFANRTECTQELEQVSRSYRTVFVQVSRTRIRKIEFTRPVVITCVGIIV